MQTVIYMCMPNCIDYCIYSYLLDLQNDSVKDKKVSKKLELYV